MKLEAVELRRVGLPLVAPFRTSFGTETHKDALMIRAIGPEGDGWGECVAMIDPLYSSEYADAVDHVVRNHLLPRVFALGDVTATSVEQALEPIKGHRMAKAAVQTAVLDADLRSAGVSMASLDAFARRCTISFGVSLGNENEPQAPQSRPFTPSSSAVGMFSSPGPRSRPSVA